MKLRIYERTVEMTEEPYIHVGSSELVSYRTDLTNEEYERLTGYKVAKNYSASITATPSKDGNKNLFYATTGSRFGGTHGTFKTLCQQEGILEIVNEGGDNEQTSNRI